MPGVTPIRPIFRILPSLGTALLAGALSVAAQGLPTAPSDERFVAGEALDVRVPLDSAAFLNGGYAIDSAGFAELPVVGRIEVAGRTRASVEEFLGQKFSNYLKDTHIQVVPAIRLTLLGFWTRQGQYYVSPKATVWDAVYKAGGMAGEVTLDQIVVRRGESEIEVSFLDEYSRGRTLAAAGVRSGDIFVMPVPRENAGAWYWLREGLAATATVATIITSFLTVYITYTLLDDQSN